MQRSVVGRPCVSLQSPHFATQRKTVLVPAAAPVSCDDDGCAKNIDVRKCSGASVPKTSWCFAANAKSLMFWSYPPDHKNYF